MRSDAIPISWIEKLGYCRRQAALVADGVWIDNRHVVRGRSSHRRVDDPDQSRSERGVTILRAVPLFSERHGLTGRADVVEVHADGTLVPVEHKHGTRHGQTADLQVCAQALCLEEMTGRSVVAGYVWYSTHRRRHRVEIGSELRRLTMTAIADLHAIRESVHLPPAPNDERCQQCQFLGHCLPDIVANPGKVQRYMADEIWA